MQHEYWASKGPETIASEIMAKVTSYKEYVEKSGLLSEIRKSYHTYYGSSNIQEVDKSLKAMHLNHYANLIRHVHVMVTSTRPAWEPRAINTDVETQADTQLAAGLLDYYMREKHIEKKLNRSTELALFLKEGWITLDWNATGGEIYGTTEDGQPIYEGDVEVNVHTILDVVRDVRQRDMNHKWFIVRTFENKWDLAAKYPELAEKISALSGDNKTDIQYEISVSNSSILDGVGDSDIIPVYTLRHAKTDAMPQGRMTKILNADITLFDGPLPYKNTYTFPITSSEQFETSFGHSQLNDLLGPQDALNMTVSSILTNQAANAVQNFQIPKGASLNVTNYDGMNVWEYDPKLQKGLESMDLLNTAPEVFKFAEFLIAQEELISGVSQINRGNAPATMSGTAMALLQQQAIQFSSGIQLSYTLMLERVGTGLIELLQTFAVVPRIAMIAGKSKRSMMRYFSNQNLKGISRVIVDSANPLTKTSAGRVEIANNLLATPNMIKTPQQYIGVLTTGNLEPLYQHDESQRMNIAIENESLMEGKQVIAILTDDHPTHILEHSCVLNSPEARENPTLVQNCLNHIQEHMNIAKTMDPQLAMVLKQASLFQPPPMQPSPGGMPQVMDNQNPITAQAEQTQLPKPAQPPQQAIA